MKTVLLTGRVYVSLTSLYLKLSEVCLISRLVHLVLAVLDGMERLTAEEMDERRQQNMAYEYLCHLEEAKR